MLTPKKNDISIGENEKVSQDEETAIEDQEGHDDEEEESEEEQDLEVGVDDDEECESLSDIEIAVKTREIAALKKRKAFTALKNKKNGASAKKR